MEVFAAIVGIIGLIAYFRHDWLEEKKSEKIRKESQENQKRRDEEENRKFNKEFLEIYDEVLKYAKSKKKVRMIYWDIEEGGQYVTDVKEEDEEKLKSIVFQEYKPYATLGLTTNEWLKDMILSNCKKRVDNEMITR